VLIADVKVEFLKQHNLKISKWVKNFWTKWI